MIFREQGDVAMTHIQQLVRGHLARVRVAELRKNFDEQHRIIAVQVLQRVYRGHVARVSTRASLTKFNGKSASRHPCDPDCLQRIQCKGFTSRSSRRSSGIGREMLCATKIQAWYEGSTRSQSGRDCPDDSNAGSGGGGLP